MMSTRPARSMFVAVAALALGRIEPGPIGELLKVAEELGQKPQWVYHFLTEKIGARAVCVPLVHEIVRQKGWKPGAAWFWIKQLRKGVEEGAA